MRRAMLLILIVPAILGLGGCGTPKPIMYYGLQIPATPAPASYTWPIEMVVGRITGTDVLEASPIVYKTGRNQMGTYQYHRWTESPVELVQAKLTRLLRTTGEYQSVSGGGNASSGELVIRGRLYDFTEVDGDAISGLVSMEFELYNRKTARILWSHFYSQTEPVEAKQVPAVVQALDRNLDRGLKETIAGLGQYFASHPPTTGEASREGRSEVTGK
jgi:ABC-type uncharacterized transport system auxiliary subunit